MYFKLLDLLLTVLDFYEQTNNLCTYGFKYSTLTLGVLKNNISSTLRFEIYFSPIYEQVFIMIFKILINLLLLIYF